ncbi:MAG: glutamine synthetase family protein, partial [Chloroflexota bacterium]|nr:glutamine synthetase family protein [Chloroflexota bacterium]
MSADPAQTERILSQAEDGACEFVDFQFTDVAGSVKSVVLPARQLRETLRYGHSFDGSSLEGSARLMETDLLLRPDVATWGLLPWLGSGGERTGRLLCDIRTPEGDPFPADPRAVLRRVAEGAAELGFTYLVASELEFFLFHAPPAHAGLSAGAARVPAGARETASPLDHGGYFDLASHHEARVRDEMVHGLSALGVPVESSHHEIGPGQQEIDLPPLDALTAADALVTCKFVVKSVARRRGLAATFMPKPVAHVAGSGLHLHQSLLDAAGRDVLADPLDEHGLSPVGRAFVAGQLAHARAMCAVLAPTVNSYKRIGRGFDAPVFIGWGHTNPLAVVRVPRAVRRRLGTGNLAPPTAVAALRPELRCPDPSCNPYLALAVALAAGLDGIRAQLELPEPVEPASGTAEM